MSITLQVENITSCNARCRFCPYPKLGDRHGNLMSMPLYRKIIDEAISIPSITSLTIQGLGEPLLDPFLEERLRHVDGRLQTLIFTNGTLLTPVKFHSLVDAGLSSMVVSLNAVRAEQHESIMGIKGKFDQVVSNCDYVIANKPDEFLFQVHTVFSSDEFTLDDYDTFISRWGKYGIRAPEGDWNGYNRTLPWNLRKPDDCCDRAIGMVYVLWDGRVSMCCSDPSGKTVFGDLSKQTLREVYNCPKYQQFREDHWNGMASKYSICKDCQGV